MEKLRNKVDDATWLSFKQYYDSAQAVVHNGGERSRRFSTSVGVKQGGPSSPLLFSIYSEELIERIKRMGGGVRIGNMVIGVICFADDVLLISNNRDEMQRMLDECEKYGLETKIKWNPTKTVFCRLGRGKRERCELKFCGEALVEQEEFKYLGVIMTSDFKCKRHILSRISKTSYAAHKLTAFGAKSKELDVYVKVFLYKTYCRPVLYYGITTSLMGKTEQKMVQKCEARMLKSIAGIRRRTKNTALLHGMGIERARCKMDLEKCKLFIQLTRNTMTRKVLEVGMEEGQVKSKKGKLTGLASEMLEICSRVRRENREAVAMVEEKEMEDTMLDSTRWNITNGIMESTTCAANQSVYMPRLDMMELEAKQTIEILMEKKKREFNSGTAESIRFLLMRPEEKMESKKLIEMMLKAFEEKDEDQMRNQ